MGNCASNRRSYDRIRALEDQNTTLEFDNTSEEQTISFLHQGIEASTRSREEQARAYAILERQHHDLQAKAAAEGDRLQVEVSKLQDSLALVQDDLATGSEALRVAEQELEKTKEELSLLHCQYHSSTNELQARLSEVEQQRAELEAGFEWEKETLRHLLLGAEIAALAEGEALRHELKVATTSRDELNSKLEASLTLATQWEKMFRSTQRVCQTEMRSRRQTQKKSTEANSERDQALEERQSTLDDLEAFLRIHNHFQCEEVLDFFKQRDRLKSKCARLRERLEEAEGDRDDALEEEQHTLDLLESSNKALKKLKQDLKTAKVESVTARQALSAATKTAANSSEMRDFSEPVRFSRGREKDLRVDVGMWQGQTRIDIREWYSGRRSQKGVSIPVRDAEQLAKLLPCVVQFAKV